MKQRIITALIGIPILFLFLLGPVILTYVAVYVAGCVTAYEFLRITNHQKPLQQALFILGLTGILITPFVFDPPNLLILFVGLLLTFNGLYISQILPFWVADGLLYIGMPLASVISLRQMEHGIEWIVVFLMATWVTDSMALFGGKTFGRTQLTAISPNKTREGTAIGIISGFIIVVMVGGVFKFLDPYTLTILEAALFLPILAVLGDLLESKIKRTYGLKDSGNLFPGHGGMLDRIDSILFTAPALWVLVVLTLY